MWKDPEVYDGGTGIPVLACGMDFRNILCFAKEAAFSVCYNYGFLQKQALRWEIQIDMEEASWYILKNKND